MDRPIDPASAFSSSMLYPTNDFLTLLESGFLILGVLSSNGIVRDSRHFHRKAVFETRRLAKWQRRATLSHEMEDCTL